MLEGDGALVETILSAMQRNLVDYTLFFRRLSGAVDAERRKSRYASCLSIRSVATKVLEAWRERLAVEGRSPAECRSRNAAVNPIYIPRNHRIEVVIEAAIEKNFAPFNETL